MQACSIRDSWQKFSDAHIIVLGVSKDSTKSHKNFRNKYDLPFPLLSDPKKEAIKKYGVLKKKSMFGKKFLGTRRSSFLIGPQGVIREIYLYVSAKNYFSLILNDFVKLA